ncbi:glucosamine 6-phosphate N-acetyltransferase [Thelephora ganbajun]|uniref:Glucosamine 6-phosphate N-acetyltransferase n=1 Tax=Thelephora ganbajun TaxID=370292 RepID=A0ACB6ZT29_THEGA|nr:glucosamine 6-phosphate N-acetyltransferase [Thelephora ganbajun]
MATAIKSSSAFTDDKDLNLAFPTEFIPAEVRAVLPEDLHIRPLSSTDYHRGHIQVLSVLSHAPDPGYNAWLSHFNALKLTASTPAPSGGLLRPTPTRANTGQGLKSNQVYFPIVIVSKANDQVVGTGTVFMEKKFLRGLGTVGHIEDIAVDKSQQGKKLGLRIIQVLTGISEGLGAYKTILNCSDHNIPFYEKCGFVKKENEMAKYAPGERSQTPVPPRL